MASLYLRGKVWWVRFKDIDGRWKDQSCGRSATKGDAEKVKHAKEGIEINMEGKTPIRIIESGLVAELYNYRNKEIFRSNSGRKKARATVVRYQACIDNFIEFVIGHQWKKFEDITEIHIKLFIDFLSETQSASSIVLHRLELIKFFKWAISQNFTLENPLINIRNPKIEKNDELEYFFSKNELYRLFSSAIEPYNRIFEFLYLTGMRPGELCASEFSMLREIENPETDQMRTDLHLPKWQDGCKTKRGRIVQINNDALAIISEQRKEAFRINTADAKKFIFVNAKGAQLDNANIYRNFYITKRKANVIQGSPKTFRHTFASHHAMAGASLMDLMKLMGHTDYKMVLRYAHLSPEHSQGVANKLSLPKPPVNLREFKAERLAAIAG